MPKIFISYSRKDEDFVRRLVASLKERGAEVWVDVHDIPAGADWDMAVQDGLTSSDLMLLIVSPESMASANVRDEWRYYRDKDKPIIPILLRPAEVHYRLNAVQRVDFHQQDYDIALDQLYTELTRNEMILRALPPTTPTDIAKVETPRFSASPKHIGQSLKPVQPVSSPETIFSLPLLEWIIIPQGTVGNIEVASFAIAKFPITHEQFQAFIDASDGYNNDKWWNFSAEAQVWHQLNRNMYPLTSETDNLPRIWVCWFESMAFCNWLAYKSDLPVTLPTEIQWQRAAQGNDGKKFPYGNEFDPKKCNTLESALNKTTSVDLYVAGKSTFGVFDMSGNVQEWCLDRYDGPTDSLRVQRGGSWQFDQNIARVDYRTGSKPDFRTNYIGFRAVVNQLI